MALSASSSTSSDLLSRVRDPLSSEEKALFLQLKQDRLPSHVAIIMDGNGRWAKQAGFLERLRGHEAGTESVRQVVRACAELQLNALTLYCFSAENWSRPASEIHGLMTLLRRFLIEEESELQDNGVRLVASGEIDRLPDDTRKQLNRVIRSTQSNQGLKLNLALSYGGRQEIVEAVREIAARIAAGQLRPEEITEDHIAAHLHHMELGDPDLLIRTSGEMRISNFMLWQIAYTEIVVTPVLWPDFRRLHLYRALVEYQGRDRRFGRVESPR